MSDSRALDAALSIIYEADDRAGATFDSAVVFPEGTERWFVKDASWADHLNVEITTTGLRAPLKLPQAGVHTPTTGSRGADWATVTNQWKSLLQQDAGTGHSVGFLAARTPC
ncbi:hypothetical protein SBRCBS47491_001836 [Sporothrix bragantina]|uniref:Uncharacterized protein n=1 Tax=Sporothrix bragantina TaxID=671064 RepID=A0ABP0B239_9PEZI